MKKIIIYILILISLFLCFKIAIPLTSGVIGYFDKTQDYD